MLKPLTDTTEFHLSISQVGNVVLLHKGAMEHTYSWAEFDETSKSINLVTETGETQALGIPVPKTLHARLDNTKEMLLVEINEDNAYENPILIKFVKPIDNTTGNAR